MTAVDMPVGTSYPASVEVDGPPGTQERLAFLIRPLTAIDIELYALGRNIVAWFHMLIIWFTVLTSGKVPEGSYNYVTQVIRFTAKVQAYVYGITDTKPGTAMEDDPNYPIRLHFQYTPEIPRLRILLNPLWTIVLYICFIPGLFLGVIGIYLGYLTTLFTGNYNPWAFEKVKRLFEWGIRLGVFMALLTDVQPPIEYT
ncbi:MAG: DUF4389 domain-containing protein [Solirubrobacteraceae bacterium]